MTSGQKSMKKLNDVALKVQKDLFAYYVENIEKIKGLEDFYFKGMYKNDKTLQYAIEKQNFDGQEKVIFEEFFIQNGDLMSVPRIDVIIDRKEEKLIPINYTHHQLREYISYETDEAKENEIDYLCFIIEKGTFLMLLLKEWNEWQSFDIG